MLTELSIENFKAFGATQEFRLARITLIYGPNSAGKSCILQALRCLKQSVESPGAVSGEFVTNGPLARLGEFSSLVHNRREQSSMRFGVWRGINGAIVEIKKEGPPGLARPLEGTADEVGIERYLSRDTRWARGGRVNRVALVARNGASLTFLHTKEGQNGGYRVESDRPVADLIAWLEACIGPGGQGSVAQEAKEPAARYLQSGQIPFFESHGWLPGLREGDDWRLVNGLLGIGGGWSDRVNTPPTDFEQHAKSIVGEWASGVETTLRGCTFVGPVRHMPSGLTYGEDGLMSEGDLGAPGLAQVLLSHPPALSRLNENLATMELPYRVIAKDVDLGFGSGVALYLLGRGSKIRLQLRDVGYGCSQLLPVLLAAVYSSEVACVEQPELHLHPRQQGHLTDLFIDSSATQPDGGNSAGPTQWIVETHSEAIVSRLQRRVREGRIECGEVVVLYVEPSDEGSRVLHLRMDERGEFLDAWPGGFFEETYWDLFGGTQ